MTHQADPGPETQLPGGGIDPGEGPLQALYREAREETGWSLGVLRKLGVYQRFTYMPEYDLWARKICHIYLCAPRLCLGPPTETGHTALWLSPEAALEAWSARVTSGSPRRFSGFDRKSLQCIQEPRPLRLAEGPPAAPQERVRGAQIRHQVPRGQPRPDIARSQFLAIMGQNHGTCSDTALGQGRSPVIQISPGPA